MNKTYLVTDKKTKEQLRILTLPEGERPDKQLAENEEYRTYDPVEHGTPFNQVVSGDKQTGA